MPRPPKKKTRVLAKASIEGVLKGAVEHRSKTFKNKKQLQIWLIDRLENALDKIDPLKLFVIGGLTVFVKQGIEWTEEVLAQLANKNSLFRSLLRVNFIWSTVESLGLIPSMDQEKVKKELDSPTVEVAQWVLSFIVAYLLVEHAGAIIEAGGNLLGVAKGLIGGLVSG